MSFDGNAGTQASGPFSSEDFDRLKQVFGFAVAWDTLYEFGFGSDNWDERYPEITGQMLEDAARTLANSRGESPIPPVSGEPLQTVSGGQRRGSRELSAAGPGAGTEDTGLLSNTNVVRRNLVNFGSLG